MKRIFSFSSIYSLFFAFCTASGFCLDKYSDIFKFDFKIFLISFSIAFILSFLFLKFLPDIKSKIDIEIPKKIENYLFLPQKKCFIRNWLIILICYIPAFLAYFPGLFTYDTLYQANFFINHDYIEINPIFHSFLVLLVLIFGLFLNSATIPIFILTLAQTLIMTAIFAYCIFIMSKLKMNKLIILLSFLFFALHPINQMFTLISTKDTLFSGLILLYILTLVELFYDKEKFFKKNINILKLILIICFMFLFRHNGFIAYILTLPFVLFALKNYKKSFICFLIPIVFYFSFGIIKKSFNIQPPPIASSIAIPLQQMGRVRKYEDKNLSELDKKAFRLIVSKDKELKYFPYNVDTIKIDSEMLHSDFIQNSIKNNPKLFICLYLKWMILYPKHYINAFFLQTFSYYYPIAKYKTIAEHFFILTYNRWDNLFGVPIYSYCFNPILRKFYDSIFLFNSFEKNPISFILFAMGVNFWIIVSGFFILFFKKQYNFILPLIIIPFLFLTVLFGPIALLRYIYQNYLIIPLMLGFCLSKFEKN